VTGVTSRAGIRVLWSSREEDAAKSDRFLQESSLVTPSSPEIGEGPCEALFVAPLGVEAISEGERPDSPRAIPTTFPRAVCWPEITSLPVTE